MISARKSGPGRSKAKNVHKWAVWGRFPWWICALLKITLGSDFWAEICPWALGGPKWARMSSFGSFSVVDLRIAQNCSWERFLSRNIALGARRQIKGTDGPFGLVFRGGFEHCSKIILGAISGPKYAPGRSGAQNGHG